jgi:hypothetical protein
VAFLDGKATQMVALLYGSTVKMLVSMVARMETYRYAYPSPLPPPDGWSELFYFVMFTAIASAKFVQAKDLESKFVQPLDLADGIEMALPRSAQ